MQAQQTVEHGSAKLGDEARLHYVSAGRGAQTIVLLHGYPQTWWEWRHVIGPLAEAGYRVVAPDYRGAGSSSRPRDGYDKHTMAGDIHALLHEHLQISEPVFMVGHDVGSMVAFAYALRYRDETASAVLMEAPLPGTQVYERLRTSQSLWHFYFHKAPNVPEMLTFGRERAYIKRFYEDFAYNPDAIGMDDVERYAHSFEQPGAMQAGFELYRAFDQDAADNRAALKRDGKLNMPVLGLGGAASPLGAIADEMLREVAEDVTATQISNAGHWIAEEQPNAFIEAVLNFARAEAG